MHGLNAGRANIHCCEGFGGVTKGLQWQKQHIQCTCCKLLLRAQRGSSRELVRTSYSWYPHQQPVGLDTVHGTAQQKTRSSV